MLESSNKMIFDFLRNLTSKKNNTTKKVDSLYLEYKKSRRYSIDAMQVLRDSLREAYGIYGNNSDNDTDNITTN